MLIVPGPQAFTPARLSRRLARLAQGNPGVSAVSAEVVHFVDVAHPLSDDEARTLHALLRYGAPATPLAEGAVRVVVPRLGTRSPWSSKATDIAHNSGLGAVRRVERGVLWRLAGTITDEAALAAELHDRMTEVVLGALEEAQRAVRARTRRAR
jgi:phosphoribosylformylglycinamidine synthase